MATTYTDTILLEANRKSSAEYISGNDLSKAAWTNDLGSGIRLDIGDTISVHSAYISEIGNEDSTIEIKGRNAINNLGERQTYTTKDVTLLKTQGLANNGAFLFPALETTDGNYGWDYSQSEATNSIRDDNIRLTHSYYKCAQGDNYISLPRTCAHSDQPGWWNSGTVWSEYNSTANGRIDIANPYRLGTDYSFVQYYGQPNGWGYNLGEQTTSGPTGSKDFSSTSTRTELSNDGKRFTLFVRKSFKNYVPSGEKTGLYLQGERDPAMMDFIWYKKTVKYDVTQGFNSPANVASQITNKMNDTNKIENISLGQDFETGVERDGEIKQNNINIKAQSNTYELFPCATAWNIKHASDIWFNDSYNQDAGNVVKVPFLNEGIDDEEFFLYQNRFQMRFNGSIFGRNYSASGSNMFTDGQVKVGWKFLGAFTSNGDVRNASFDSLIGAEIISIQEIANSSATYAAETGTYLTFDKVLTVAAFKLPDAGPSGTGWYFSFTQDHIPSLYESCYSTVGYLRPEIQEAGPDLMKDPNFDRPTIDGSFQTLEMDYPMTGILPASNTILTKIPWTDDNLQKLRKVFDAESLYPEIFNYDGMSASQQGLINVNASTKSNVSVDKMRFLWMNNASQETTLGVDVDISASLTTTDPFRQEITVSSTQYLKKGMRLYFSDADTQTQNLFPRDTFITGIIGSKVYVNNAFNAGVPYVLNTDGIYFCNGGIGNDGYTSNASFITSSHTAGAVFFDYNPELKDISSGEGLGSSVYDSLTYGFAKKITSGGAYFIGFSVEKYQSGTLPNTWFLSGSIDVNRAIGFDKHFNGYSTSAILLNNGYATVWGSEYNASTLTTPTQFKKTSARNTGVAYPVSGSDVNTLFRVWQKQPDFDGWLLQIAGNGGAGGAPNYGPSANSPTTSRVFNELYCGANQPSLQFTADSSRFSFVNLHTPELIGTNDIEVGKGQDVADSSTPCFKMNKRMSRLNYSPNFLPYNNVFKVTTSASYNSSTTLAEKDSNITPYSIMDAQAGIYIEDYGCNEANWTQSLWELMGFSYSQFHNVGSRLQRFNDTTIPTSTPTTNAIVRTEDMSNGVTRGTSSIPIHNSLEVNYPFWRYDLGQAPASDAGTGITYNDKTTVAHEAFPGYIHYPAITQADVKSTTLEAENLPRKMLSPIYLIKSDLLNPIFIGGREGTSSLPVIAVVDKSSGYGDFYTGAKESTIFTNTIPRTIQNIKTSIVDADGSESRVDDSSCIIYKVTKQIKDNSVVLENILNPPKSQ